LANTREQKKDKRGSTKFESPMPQSSEPNQRVHMNFFKPLKTKPLAKILILFVTDNFSKYVEQVEIPDRSSTTVGSFLFSRWPCRNHLSLEIKSIPLEIILHIGGVNFA
jgi:hypothetical protein